MTETYGKRKVSKMYAQINALREAIRTEGTPAIQSAWDAVEEHIDFAYSGNAVPVETAAGVLLDAQTHLRTDVMRAGAMATLVDMSEASDVFSAALRVLAGRE